VGNKAPTQSPGRNAQNNETAQDTHNVIQITPELALDRNEIHISYVQSSGPGGQNVNKVATAAQLRFDVAQSPSLPENVRERLLKLAGKNVTQEGWLVIDARRFRTQKRNRQDAIDRLVAYIRAALREPKQRRKTKPSRAAKQRRLESKRRRSEVKRLRKPPPPEH
jgi:ribosome-associated protein